MSGFPELSRQMRAELCNLAAAMCDGRATPEQRDRLESLMWEDERAKALYLAYMRMHAALRWRWQGQAAELPPGVESAPLTEDGSREDPPTRLPILGFLGDLTRGVHFHGQMLALCLVTLLLFCMGLLSVWETENTASSLAVAYDHVCVGRLTATAEVIWADDSSRPEIGMNLLPGQVLELSRGLAEATFSSGAKLILEGPIKYQVLSEDCGSLHSGRLTVSVPAGAPPFALETPKFTLDDLGTEYGVDVDRQGIGKLEVFDGAVEIRVDTLSGGIRPRQIEAGQVVYINSSGKATLREPPPESKPFVRRMPAPTEPDQIWGLRMWLRADAGVFRKDDDQGTVPAVPGDPVSYWMDQSGNGLSPTQEKPSHRPRLAVNSRGKYVLRFDGNQYLHQPGAPGPDSLVLDPSDAGSNPQFTMFFMVAVGSGLEDSSLRLPDSLRDDYRSVGPIFGQFDKGTTSSSRFLFVGADGRLLYDEWEPGSGWLRPPVSRKTVFGTSILVTLVRDDNNRAMYVNSVLAACDEVAEDYDGRTPCRWWIGGRPYPRRDFYFIGDMAEILIYTRALPPAQRLAVERYLRNKYFEP